MKTISKVLHEMNKLKYGFVTLVMVGTFSLCAQQKVTINGYLTDASTGEALIYANIYLQGSNFGTSSNEYGYYAIDITIGVPQTIIYSYLGYESKSQTFNTSENRTTNVELAPEGAVLAEVEVLGKRSNTMEEEVSSTVMSTVNIPMESIKSLPSIGGELDIIKVVQLFPGVTKGGEGNNGMFVRGGDADQNLVLLDEATVYNISHLFGFFSVFNPDAIKDINLIKGAFPSNYGGRLSSVLDIRMKEGNNKGFHGSGGIGILSSRLTLEGPLLKDKASFLISGRRTYIDKFLGLFGIPLPYYFYDLNAKLNYKISDKDRIFISGYFGDDVLAFNAKTEDEEQLDLGFGFRLGNLTQTARWNHLFSPKLFSNLSLIYTSFQYDIEGKVADNSVLIKSNIKDYGVKLDFTYFKTEKSTLKYGFQSIMHNFRPNILSAQGDVRQLVKNREGEIQTTYENAIYVNLESKYGDRFNYNVGLRGSATFVKGRTYAGLEPRLAGTYLLGKKNSIKLSYSRMFQYMHLVSSSTVALPTDLWYPVSKNVKPQRSDQVALGWSGFLSEIGAQYTIETYYKWMNNLIEYKEGSNLILNDNFESLLLQGKGESYGLEVMLRKMEGRFNGWLAYNLGYSQRFFDELNGGDPFWSKYDRRHTFSAVFNYEITSRIVFSTIWEYISGSRFTPLVANYLYPDPSLSSIELLPVYSKRNAQVLSSSHRLDVNIVFKSKRTRKFKYEFHVGAYNAYNRAMPYRINVEVDPNSGKLIYTQPGLFGFIPSLAFNFEF